ncbi:hypothetical protein M408DRAFT_31241 [Serendipita vermifera MAFF 305830]|uniref:Uncharacterized protein n=1 Tax=Serendipita vermifera MAFF 305830 TaxID=933852 RepID=A0A0C2VYL6_SERVB|nr:hypothetical protein M408DRAFT_31241 [Serendipita vermifera MAFF 305830]
MKVVAVEAKKSGRVFQEQDSVSSADLQGLEDASNWNGLLLNARGERGPQWDVTSQMHHVDFGSDEYFNPQLLQDDPPPVIESETKQDTSQQQDVNIVARMECELKVLKDLVGTRLTGRP